MSAPADRDASQLYYSYRIKGGGGGGEREILVVVTQCLLLPTGMHHSYTTHTVLRGEGGGGEREILVVVTQCLLLPTGMHHSYTTHTVSLGGGGGGGTGERARWVGAITMGFMGYWGTGVEPGTQYTEKVSCTVWKMMMMT